MSRTQGIWMSVGDCVIAVMLLFLSSLAVMSTGCKKETQSTSDGPLRTQEIPAFADAKDRFMDTDDPEYQSQKHGFAVRFPQDPEVQSYLAGTAYETTAHEAMVEGQGRYKVTVNALALPEPILSDRALATFLENSLSAKLGVFGEAVKALRKEHVLFLGRRALAYEYELLTGAGPVCFKGFYIVNGRTGYEVGVLFQKKVKDSVLSDYRAFVSSFRLSS